MNIYIGNLAYQATEDDLRKAFESFGEVTSVRIITDKLSGKSRGIGICGNGEQRRRKCGN